MRQSGKKLSSFFKLRILGYFLLRFKWILGWFIPKFSIRIHRPVFFLGNQGDGLTLISRVIRRNNSFVTVSGGSNYWTGADEMAIVMEPVLRVAWRSSGFLTKDIIKHKFFRSPRSWTYGIHDLIGHYRKTSKDITNKDAQNLKSSIKSALAINGRNKRFLDKSQIFTIKVGALNHVLLESDPYFVLVLRNPYASIYRAALHMKRDDMYKDIDISFNEKIKYAAEHWYNCMTAFEEDRKEIKKVKEIRIEDFLKNPEKEIRELCLFLDIEFDSKILPSPNDKVPYFTRYNLRWYPLRQDLNDKYLKKITSEEIDIINKIVKNLPKKYGYEPSL